MLAVDGGGTRCRIALQDLGGETFQVETGSANVSSDFDGACAEINTGLDQLSQRSGMALERIREVPCYLGLAGMLSPEIATRLQQALPLSHMRIADDRGSALRGVLGPHNGAVAHCGTGSFLGCQSDGALRLVGGWGARLGDEASAQWLGRLALSRTLDVIDGLASPAPLCTSILDRLATSGEIVEFAEAATPAELGHLSKLVTRHAAEGDHLAQTLLQSGADYIADILTKLHWQPGSRLCLTGGVGAFYAPYLPEQMQAALMPPEGEPIQGALSLAADFAVDLAKEINNA